MESIEASGKSVDEAIAQALSRLNKRREEVEVAVLQEPSRKAFGLGSKDARVRVTVRAGVTDSRGAGAIITPELADAILGSGDIEIPLPDQDEDLYTDEEISEEEEEEEYEEEEYEEEEEEDLEDEDNEPMPFIASSEPSLQPLIEAATVAAASGEIQDVEHPSREDVEITVDVLQNILRYMSIHATIQVRTTNPLTLNIRGINENLGLLIGRRGETLAALQLLVNLIVSHRTKHRMRIIVDAENYRERREENLRSLAQRVAQQVRNYRRSIALEAMPPHERRIVHIALAESKDISTESIGEGEERRVVISLKRPAR
ncbi:RNA-binding cell elongation regulator Jag/EloR [Dictyobacter arantiisoli]|uniref:RNA-binding protein KhpB n=1 Tax=Dictyobacter arantiisoli TaxID=2014874 RepID=A0A5A5T6C9_9CHLR|nr:RNA-binding cell elongation regulator Jag/EloR [Dictyobacter arantiisoli]GCF06564.1 hypothetical protein KDI_01280 [Dictyobacter arantiisoli]